jgi:transposase
MRKVREVLRLKHTLEMSYRQISEATGVGKTVVGEYVRRAGVIGYYRASARSDRRRRARSAAVSSSGR